MHHQTYGRMIVDATTGTRKYIRVLELTIHEWMPFWFIVYEDFRQILRHVPNLVALRLDAGAVNEAPPEAQPKLYRPLVPIQNFRLGFNFSHGVLGLIPLRAFTRIDHLEIFSEDDDGQDYRWPGEEDLAKFEEARRLRVRSLFLSAGTPCIFALRKVLQPTLRMLEVLYLDLCPPGSHGIAGLLIRDAAPSLRALKIDLSSGLHKRITRPMPCNAWFATHSPNYELILCFFIQTRTPPTGRSST